MKKTPTTNRTRRRFLSLCLLGGAALNTPEVEAQVPDPEDSETMQMLTPDGKLVEVTKQTIAQSENRNKASNEDILTWSKTAGKSK
ncbi:MAG TPA: hypothetical protein VI603_05605 [Saprospiraceae bacterium]|nr:hypothetical protein [Saprospiraceae bacterium]